MAFQTLTFSMLLWGKYGKTRSVNLKQYTLRASLFLAVVIGLLGSFMTYGGASGQPGYQQIRVEKGSIEASLLATGEVVPFRRVGVKFPIGGRVEKVIGQEGAPCKKGEVLMWVSSLERAALMDSAQLKGPKELAYWQKRFPATPLVAPITGTIIRRNFEEGQIFTEFDHIFTLADKLVVEASVDETDLGQIRVEQEATVILDSEANHHIPARVASIAFEATTNANVTTYKVKVFLDEAPKVVRIGLTANVRFHLPAKEGILWLPTEAIKAHEQGFYVLVASVNGKQPEQKTVKTGITDGHRIEIVSGLNAGDIVLVPELSNEHLIPKTSVFQNVGL